MGRAWGSITPLLTIILLLSSITAPAYGQYKPPHDEPGPAVDKVGFRAFAVEIVPAAMEKGEMDLYMFALRTATAKEMLGKPGVEIYQAPATSVAIVLNPAPAPEGELNPFSIREVRFALQYLVNRDFVANEIYKGLAVPMTTHISPFDYDYLTVYDLIKEYNLHYNPEMAKRMVKDALIKAGAVQKEGIWFYNDKPIRLKFIIRVEDERRDIGDTVAVELEKLGFTVERIYQLFGPAIHKVYGTDPRVFEWHLYTEGWGKAFTEKYDYATINQMNAPWFGNMPGWQEVGYWQYENPQLDEVCKKIFMGEFKDVKERDDLYRKATTMGVNESIRLWVVTVKNIFPAKAEITGITGDLASGPRGIWALREAYIPGKRELTVGHLWVWTERTTWNPVGGFTDVYSVDIWRNIYDPPMWRHPFTGLPMPFRVDYKVETAGPAGKLSIPETAFFWDSGMKKWSGVEPGTQAKSKVTFNYAKYINSKWHHGQPIKMADILYALYQAFDLAYDPDKSKIEFALATTSRPYLDTFRGFNILNSTALEVYVDYWHFIPDYIAEYAHPFGVSTPWEILAAMDTLVFEKRMAAYSDTAAERFRVPWLSLVMDKDARLVKTTLMDFLSKGFFPENVFTIGEKLLIEKEDAAERYKAAIAWFDEYKNMVISNGPFMLTRFDPPSQYAELKAFRDPNYPFKPGKWYFGTPTPVEISGFEGDSIVISSETVFKVQVQGPGELAVRYLLFDPVKGKVLKVGEGDRVAPGRFMVRLPSELTSKMEATPYQLFLAAYSNEVSLMAERMELVKAITAPPEKPPPETTLPPPETKPPETKPPETVTPPPEVGAPPNMIWLGAGLAAVVVVAVAVFALRRRKPSK